MGDEGRGQAFAGTRGNALTLEIDMDDLADRSPEMIFCVRTTNLCTLTSSTFDS
jgi:hypothetical protein